MVKKGGIDFKKAGQGSKVPKPPAANVAGKGKGPIVYPAKAKVDPKDVVCSFCQQPGHYKRGYKKFQDEQKNAGGTSSSGIYYIEVNISTNSG